VSLAIGILTASDTRTEATDRNGPWLRHQIESAGHQVAGYRLERDEPLAIEQALDALAEAGSRVILTNGGTGIAKRDTTYDVVAGRLTKSIPGFGELFRMLSWDEIGAAAMLSRATAGVWDGRLIFCMPGSHAAVRLAWSELIRPELEHLAWELTR